MLSKSRVKYIQSLQQKKFRELHQCFVAEGPKVVKELLEQHYFPVKEIVALQQWADQEYPLIAEGADKHIVSDQELEKVSALSAPNQVVAVFGFRSEIFSVPEKGLVLALDNIRDPGNFGTILRIADWFGIRRVICSPGCVDMYNPKVVQSTMASLGRVQVHYMALEEVFEQSPLPVFAAGLHGKPLGEVSPISDGIILIGNESTGVRKELLAASGQEITIPRIGEAESLNAAVATGIILYHFTHISGR